jgi:hypothetical protein
MTSDRLHNPPSALDVSLHHRIARLPRLLALAASVGLAASSFAEKPAALSELSITIKETYDTNVFGTEYNPVLAGRPEIADLESWVTTVSPKVGVNLMPVFGLGKDSAITALSLGYQGDYAFYHSASTETNQRHNFTQQIKTKSGDISFALDNSFIYVDGKTTTPFYSLYNAYGTPAARERREQFQDRAKFVYRQNFDSVFVRCVGSLLYYDLKTRLNRPVGNYLGYQNFVDRKDLNAGLDLGEKITKDVAVWAGYRVGAQQQDRLPWAGTLHCNSTYQRVLVGLEGKVAPWLKVDLQGGPDYRSYSDVAHLGLIGKHHTWIYTEGSITADVSKNDSLVFTNKIWHWVSSTSTAAYRDSSYTLNYKHKFSSALSGTIGARALGSEYDKPTLRKDWLFGYSLGLRYDITKQYALTLDYAHNAARNKFDDHVKYPGREFNQDLISLGLRAAF